MKCFRIIIVIILLLLINSYVFAFNEYDSSAASSNIGNFYIFSGTIYDRQMILDSDFDLHLFSPYNMEKLINKKNGENYHAFKTFFRVSDKYKDKNLTLYISRFDMPVLIRINNIIIYQKGFRQEIDKTYSTGETAAMHLPLNNGLINYNEDNSLVIEVFPQYETSSLPQMSIAEYKNNVIKVFIKNFLNVYMVLAAQFLAMLVSIYHFGSFFSRGCKDPKYIIFAFFSMSFALAYANIGFSFDSKYYTELVKITRCFQLFSLGFYLMFIIQSVGLFVQNRKFILLAIVLYSVVCTGYIAIQPDKFTVNAAFSKMTNFYLIPVLLFCIIIPIISIIIKKNFTIFLFLFTTLMVAAASLRDMLLLSAAAQPLFWYAPYSFLLIIIVIYGILVYEESTLFKNFKKYVPADLVIQLINQNIRPELGGKQQELTIFFSDISKFTSIVEKMEPERLIQDLCVYFESISKIILNNKGTIDKYIGDAVMAFWGAPIPMDDHAKKACHTALTVQSSLKKLFSQWDNQGKVPFITRIGIHTGNVIVGNLGYKERLNYTVMGDTVNVSSRLEGINKVYGTEIIVSEDVYIRCSHDFEFRFLDRVSLLGRREGLNIYELITFKDDLDKREKRIIEYYETGLKYYFEQNWMEALKYFNTVLKYRPSDMPGRLMRKRCLQYKENPPSKAWNGVFAQEIK